MWKTKILVIKIFQTEKSGISRNRIMCYHEKKIPVKKFPSNFITKEMIDELPGKHDRSFLEDAGRNFFSFSLIFCPSLKGRNATS